MLRALVVALCLVVLGSLRAEAQITFVNSADLGNNGGTLNTLTASYTVTAGSTMLRISFLGDLLDSNGGGGGPAGNDDITSVTYGGNAATLDLKDTTGYDSGDGGSRYKYSYVLYSPPTGANNVVITATNTHYLLGGVSEYKGTALSGPDATATANNGLATSVTGTTTVAHVGSWVFGFTENYNGSSAPTAGSGATFRVGDGTFKSWAIFDSNSAPGTGSQSMTANLSPASLRAFIMDNVSFAPPQAGGLLTMGCCN